MPATNMFINALRDELAKRPQKAVKRVHMMKTDERDEDVKEEAFVDEKRVYNVKAQLQPYVG